MTDFPPFWVYVCDGKIMSTKDMNGDRVPMMTNDQDDLLELSQRAQRAATRMGKPFYLVVYKAEEVMETFIP